MSDLDIRADGEHRYLAGLTTDDGTTNEYVVEVPEALLTDLNLEAADEPTLVRTALELLLERPGSQLPRTFSLDDADAAYAGFAEELRAAAGR